MSRFLALLFLVGVVLIQLDCKGRQSPLPNGLFLDSRDLIHELLRRLIFRLGELFFLYVSEVSLRPLFGLVFQERPDLLAVGLRRRGGGTLLALTSSDVSVSAGEDG